jgi:integrase
VIPGAGSAIEAAYAGDTWNANDLGMRARRGRDTARFGVISQLWLREALKTWSRFRLATGTAFSTVDSGAQSLRRFSVFLADAHPEIVGLPGVTRVVIEQYLSWLAGAGLATNTRSTSAIFLKGLFDWGHRYGTLTGLRADAVLYEDDVARPADALPLFIPEFIMAQLESDAALERLPSRPTCRNLVVVLMETGMRGGDACELPFNPLIEDSVGWPCLRFANSKASSEQLIPLSEKAAATIKDQQDYVTRTWPSGSPWLFPGIAENPDGTMPYAHGSLSGQLGRWQKIIDVRDESGQRVRIHAHQFRHTVGTRMINKGVPQHVIQKMLGQASPRMTARYAQLFDQTVRQAFEAYCAQRVNTTGEAVPFDPDASTADAEWVKHNLARVRDSLPNGYCGRPPQQDCPHPNACLTCPDFQTTPEFLDIHRKQATTNRILIARRGCQRPVPPGRESAAGARQPRAHHPGARGDRG